MKLISRATRLRRKSPFSGIHTIRSVCKRPVANLGPKKWKKAVSKEIKPLNGLLIQIWKGLDVPERLILSK